MPEEQEERIIGVTKPCFCPIRYPDTEDEDAFGVKGTEYHCGRNGVPCNGPILFPEKCPLSLAPKHTDEEHDEVLARLNNCHREWARLDKVAIQYELRIKELEARKPEQEMDAGYYAAFAVQEVARK